MEKDLGNYRRSYERKELNEDSVPDNPIQLFQTWFYEVEKFDGSNEPNAMNLSTIGIDEFPKNRIVLLKRYSHEGFTFFTNYKSEKGLAISENPNVCLSFFWSCLERQVIVKGIACKIAENLSDGYFESRPLGSKLSAIISKQSNIVSSKAKLESMLQKAEIKFEGLQVERPEHWGGYIVKPISLEFWQGRPNRLHDRIRYTLQQDLNWKIDRLYP